MSHGTLIVLSSLVIPGTAWAEELSANYDIPAQPLAQSLEAVASQAHVQMLYSSDLVKGIKGHAVKGSLTAFEALAQLLQGTGLVPKSSGEHVFAIAAVSAQNVTALPPVTVAGNGGTVSNPSSSVLSGADLVAKRQGNSDTASLLAGQPGVTLYGGGGVSSLPALHGLGDQRVLTEVDGMQLSSMCPNHMNPALSYIAPTAVGKVTVIPGLSPVSAGGDNIGGVIAVESAPPMFAAPDEDIATHGQLSAFYRSNNRAIGTSGSVAVANSDISLGYSGEWIRARDYHASNGTIVPLTSYEIHNHAVTAAVRNDSTQVTAKFGGQYIPYQGFLNEPMDMVENRSWFGNLRLQGNYGWGNLDGKAYYQTVMHQMNNLSDRGGNMPMNEDGNDFGYGLKGEIPVSTKDTLRIGNEFHGQRLNDVWPDTLPNPNFGYPTTDLAELNHGWRDRLGTFAEWERNWTDQWSTEIGLRNDMVFMGVGDGHGYYPTSLASQLAAKNFNSIDHSRQDANFDVTARTRYESDLNSDYQFGVARKTRSPDLYERYGWQMTNMVGWSGDGNNYQGNPDLKPEVAYNVGASANWHDDAQKDWEVTVSPYYTYVHDYIDVQYAGTSTLGTALGQMVGGRKIWKFQYVNQDAWIYGLDVGGKKLLLTQPGFGSLTAKAQVGLQRGENTTTGNSLYRMMPLNGMLTLEHKLDGWTNDLEIQAVNSKTNVDPIRHDPVTPGYALVNLKTNYVYENLKFDVGITNLFDHNYYLPLGGTNMLVLGANSNTGPRVPILGEGRSYNLGVTISF